MPTNPPRAIPKTETATKAVKAQLPLVAGILYVVACGIAPSPVGLLSLPLAFLAGTLFLRGR